jgi:hypothetical protein
MRGLGPRRRLIAPGAFVAAFLLLLGVFALRDAQAGNRFDVVRWERTTLANKWLNLAGAPFHDDLSDDEALRRYFALDDLHTDEAHRLENQVEAIIEGRIDAVLEDLDISARIDLPGSVFPPVDVELASSPRVLVTSPRDHIERLSADLLRPDLTEADFEAIESKTEESEDLSALVVGTGGVATYPAVVADGRSYRSTVATAAHEWTHHYLVFYPLGRSYYESSDLQVINETVADVVGDELGKLILDRWGDPTVTPATPTPEVTPTAEPTPAPTQTPEPEQPRLDRNEVLRNLRLEVDALLADGHIDQAEARMEEVRQELCDAGYCLRRINQAYFAWYGTYAARPDATDPIGPQVFAIREESNSLADFLARVRGATSRPDIEALASADEANEDG